MAKNYLVEEDTLLFESDLIVSFGVAYSDRTTCKSEVFANGTPVVNINIEPYSFGNVNIICDNISSYLNSERKNRVD